jgi:phosphoribosylformylglycinamidine synthase
VESAHDCSDGGLAVALAECVMADNERHTGAEVDLSAWDHVPLTGVLFGETQGRVIVSTSAPERVIEIAQRRGVPARNIGTVRSADDGLTIRARGTSWHAPIVTLADAYHGSIPRIMDGTPQSVAVEETDGVAV